MVHGAEIGGGRRGGAIWGGKAPGGMGGGVRRTGFSGVTGLHGRRHSCSSGKDWLDETGDRKEDRRHLKGSDTAWRGRKPLMESYAHRLTKFLAAGYSTSRGPICRNAAALRKRT